MEHLRILVRLVADKSQQPLPLLGQVVRKPGKETTLYEKIESGEYQTDEQAAQDLYGAAPTCSSYQMLKSRLRQKLLNQLFFLDFSDESVHESKRCEMECWHALHQAQILMTMTTYSVAEKLLGRTLKQARDFEFTAIAIACLESLLYIYALKSNRVDYEKSEALLATYQSLAIAEQNVSNIYCRTRLNVDKSVSNRVEYLTQFAADLQIIKRIWEQTRSSNVFQYYYLLRLWYMELIGDYEEIIAIAEEANESSCYMASSFKKFDYRFNQYISVFAYLRTKKYEQGLILAEEYVKLFDRLSNNYFAFMENYVLLALHSRRYALAHHLLEQVTSNPYFSKINEKPKERWAMYQAYLWLMYPIYTPTLFSSFTGFLASVPQHSKDKQGLNVSITLLQFLHTLKHGRTEDLLYVADRLKKYASQHLKDSLNNRAVLFIRLLHLPVRCDFNAEQCRRKGQRLYEQLQATPTPGDAHAEVEIIPYEHLWEWALAAMSNEKRNVATAS